MNNGAPLEECRKVKSVIEIFVSCSKPSKTILLKRKAELLAAYTFPLKTVSCGRWSMQSADTECKCIRRVLGQR